MMRKKKGCKMNFQIDGFLIIKVPMKQSFSLKKRRVGKWTLGLSSSKIWRKNGNLTINMILIRMVALSMSI